MRHTIKLNPNGPILWFSGYWHMFERVLLPQTHKDGVVSVSLTAINPSWEHPWEEDVKPIVFWHRDCFYPDARWDWWGRFDLPEYYWERMCEMLGKEFSERLLKEDWLSLIDLEKLKKTMRCGGVPFAEIRRG